MTEIENPTITTYSFIETWRVQDPERLAAELISLNKETNRQPDTYYFYVNDGLLIDPATQKPVMDFISQGPEKSIAGNLQRWAVENEDGLAYWISPRQEGVYPCEKIIINRIAYTIDRQKVILNSAILFDADLDEPDRLRKTFFTLKDTEENLFKIISWVEYVSSQQIKDHVNSDEYYRQVSYFAGMIKTGVNPDLIIEEMQRTGFLGENPVSCPSKMTFSQYMDSRSSLYVINGNEDRYGSLTFKCPKCRETNTRPYGRLISNCQYCGANVRC